MQDIPHAPSHKHFFFLLLQSSCDEHFRKHFWLNSVAYTILKNSINLNSFVGINEWNDMYGNI